MSGLVETRLDRDVMTTTDRGVMMRSSSVLGGRQQDGLHAVDTRRPMSLPSADDSPIQTSKPTSINHVVATSEYCSSSRSDALSAAAEQRKCTDAAGNEASDVDREEQTTMIDVCRPRCPTTSTGFGSPRTDEGLLIPVFERVNGRSVSAMNKDDTVSQFDGRSASSPVLDEVDSDIPLSEIRRTVDNRGCGSVDVDRCGQSTSLHGVDTRLRFLQNAPLCDEFRRDDRASTPSSCCSLRSDDRLSDSPPPAPPENCNGGRLRATSNGFMFEDGQNNYVAEQSSRAGFYRNDVVFDGQVSTSADDRASRQFFGNHASWPPPMSEDQFCGGGLYAAEAGASPFQTSTRTQSSSAVKMLKCPRCNWHYKYRETLEIHVREKHAGDPTAVSTLDGADSDPATSAAAAQCPYCVGGAGQHPRLARGETYACGYKPYRCDVCRYSTTTKGNLSIHMQSDRHVNNLQELTGRTLSLPCDLSQSPLPLPPPVQHHPLSSIVNRDLSSALDGSRMRGGTGGTGGGTGVGGVNGGGGGPRSAWTCDVCGYSTLVARNLRIHMTSEKHAHNVALLQQQHQQQQQRHHDLQQTSLHRHQLQQLSAAAAAAAAASPAGFAAALAAALPWPPTANAAAAFLFDHGAAAVAPVDLTRSSTSSASRRPSTSIDDKFCSSDNGGPEAGGGESSRTADAVVADAGGAYTCDACPYRTTLKANFQLHCQSDKHSQRVRDLAALMACRAAGGYIGQLENSFGGRREFLDDIKREREDDQLRKTVAPSGEYDGNFESSAACRLCRQSFDGRAALQNHLLRDHRVRPEVLQFLLQMVGRKAAARDAVSSQSSEEADDQSGADNDDDDDDDDDGPSDGDEVDRAFDEQNRRQNPSHQSAVAIASDMSAAVVEKACVASTGCVRRPSHSMEIDGFQSATEWKNGYVQRRGIGETGGTPDDGTDFEKMRGFDGHANSWTEDDGCGDEIRNRAVDDGFPTNTGEIEPALKRARLEDPDVVNKADEGSRAEFRRRHDDDTAGDSWASAADGQATPKPDQTTRTTDRAAHSRVQHICDQPPRRNSPENSRRMYVGKPTIPVENGTSRWIPQEGSDCDQVVVRNTDRRQFVVSSSGAGPPTPPQSDEQLLRGLAAASRLKSGILGALLETIGLECVVEFNEGLQRTDPLLDGIAARHGAGEVDAAIRRQFLASFDADFRRSCHTVADASARRSESSENVPTDDEDAAAVDLAVGVRRQMTPPEVWNTRSPSPVEEEMESFPQPAALDLRGENDRSDVITNHRFSKPVAGSNRAAVAGGYEKSAVASYPDMALWEAMQQFDRFPFRGGDGRVAGCPAELLAQLANVPMIHPGLMFSGFPHIPNVLSMMMMPQFGAVCSVPPTAGRFQGMVDALLFPVSTAASTVSDPPHGNASSVAVQSKRARTRITDAQLTVLRARFDLSGSPSDEDVATIACETGLPAKVVKHWFRNTLFKERQRCKDSPYNFSVPPVSHLELNEDQPTPDFERIRQPELEVKQETTEATDGAKQPVACGGSNTSAWNEPLPPVTSSCASADSNQSGSSLSCSGAIPVAVSGLGPSMMPAEMPFIPPGFFNPAAYQQPMLLQQTMASVGVDDGPRATSSPLAGQHGGRSGSGHHGKRASRTHFTDDQVRVLHEHFERNAYPRDDELESLSRRLGLSARVIVVWFQNARQKARRTYENQSVSAGGGGGSGTSGAGSSTSSSRDDAATAAAAADASAAVAGGPAALKYECRSCGTVFQRYYELIKHQRSHAGCGSSESSKDSTNSSSAALPAARTHSCSAMTTGGKRDSSRGAESVQQPRDFGYASPIVAAAAAAAATSTAYSPLSLTSRLIASTENGKSCDVPRRENYANVFDMQAMMMMQNFAPVLNLKLASPQQQQQQQLQQQQQQQQQQMQQRAAEFDGGAERSFGGYSSDDRDQRRHSRDMKDEDESYSPVPPHKQVNETRRATGQRTAAQNERPAGWMAEPLPTTTQCTPNVTNDSQQCTTLLEKLEKLSPINSSGDVIKQNFQHFGQSSSDRPDDVRAVVEADGDARAEVEGLLDAQTIQNKDFRGFVNPAASTNERSWERQNSEWSPVSTVSPNERVHDKGDVYQKVIAIDNSSNRPPMAAAAAAAAAAPKESNSGRSTFGNSSTVASEYLTKSEVVEPYASTADDSSSFPDCKMSGSADREEQSSDEVEEDADEEDYDDDMKDDAPLDLSRSSKRAQHGRMPSDLGANPALASAAAAGFQSVGGSGNGSSSAAEQRRNSASTGSSSKRHRTHMTDLQVRVMRAIYADHRTPSIGECATLGTKIGLARRVVQVWFQNARAKDKKRALTEGAAAGDGGGSDVGATMSGAAGDDEGPSADGGRCRWCGVMYAADRLTVREHVFTQEHVSVVERVVRAASEAERRGSGRASKRDHRRRMALAAAESAASGDSVTPTGTGQNIAVSNSGLQMTKSDAPNNTMQSYISATTPAGIMPPYLVPTAAANGTMMPFVYPGFPAGLCAPGFLPPRLTMAPGGNGLQYAAAAAAAYDQTPFRVSPSRSALTSSPATTVTRRTEPHVTGHV